METGAGEVVIPEEWQPRWLTEMQVDALDGKEPGYYYHPDIGDGYGIGYYTGSNRSAEEPYGDSE